MIIGWIPENTSSGYAVVHGGTVSAAQGMIPAGSINKAVNRRFGEKIHWNVLARSVSTPVNEWHVLEITEIDNRITTSINGEQVAEFIDEKDWYKSGALGLACRPTLSIRISEILIEELPSAARPE